MSTSKRRRPSSKHQPRQRPGPVVVAVPSLALERAAALIRAQLRARRADFAPLPRLTATTGIDHATVAATVARYPDLGITGGGEHPVIYSVDPATTVVGFEAIYRRGRMILRLGSVIGPPWPLSISGAHLGTAVNDDDPEPEHHSRYGSGELAYAIARLTLMARRWLILPDQPSSHDVTVRLFELIARAWYASPGPAWSSGRLHVHRAELDLPVGTQFWHNDTPTNSLELVVWADKVDGFQLVNIYPAGTYRSVFDTSGDDGGTAQLGGS